MKSPEKRHPENVPGSQTPAKSLILADWEVEEARRCPETCFQGLTPAEKESHFVRDGLIIFTDHNHFYRYLLGDHVLFRFQIQSLLGEGGFSQVFKAYDHKKSFSVAVKICRNVPDIFERSNTEISLLRRLAFDDPYGEANVVRLLSIASNFRGHFVFAFELLGQDLHEVISKNKRVGFPEPISRRVAYSLLQGVKYLHERNIVHCDLKPPNIALKLNNRGVKIIDLGHAFNSGEVPSEYTQTRYYRAPEVFLGIIFDKPVDMWSFGCVVGELLMGLPLLMGRDARDQYVAILELCGDIPPPLLDRATKPERVLKNNKVPQDLIIRCLCGDVVCDSGPNASCRCSCNPCDCARASFCPGGSWVLRMNKDFKDKSRGPPGSKSIEAALKGRGSPVACELIRRCLELDPAKRITAEEALNNSWFCEMTPQEINSQVDLFAE